MGVLEWIEGILSKNGQLNAASDSIEATTTLDQLELQYKSLPEDIRNFPSIADRYSSKKGRLEREQSTGIDPLGLFIEGALDAWLKKIKDYETKDPAVAKENLVKLSKDVMITAAATAGVDLALGMLPNDAGTASSANTKELMRWLGMGAVVTAVAHDPVKIGLLRPYQDSLEQTFRNRRPDDMALFQAYRTRELAPEKVEDLEKLDEAVMARIENDNDRIYHEQISRWGYSEDFATALSRSATFTPRFNDAMQLARQGLLSKGLAIYSLWGSGYDRVVMKPMLDALMEQNRRGSYEGFRSMIEPAYREGVIEEADLVAYWTRISVPAEVQAWVLPRLRKQREAYLLKAAGSTAQKERDLTVSQVQQAYQNLLLDRARAQNMILALGYSLDEAKIILDLAELRRKLPAAQTLKRLPLSDYEKAHKNGLLKVADVLERMRGEYAPGDIELERKLLEIGKA